MTRPALVVLDVNETLSDLAPLDEVFASVGAPGDRAAWFAGVLRDGFALSLSGTSPRFADLAADGLRGLGLPDDAVDRVLTGFTGLGVHPDVVPGLRALAAAGTRLVTLSNGATSVAESLLERAGLCDVVEACLSVEDAPAWKPDARAYVHALTHAGVPADEAMLVAAHPWDVDGAARAGLRTAYVDRVGGPWPTSFRPAEVTVNGFVDLARRLDA